MEKEVAIHGGTVMEAKQAELDNAKRIYERILSTVTTLAECLNKEVPVLEVQILFNISKKLFQVLCLYRRRKKRMRVILAFLCGKMEHKQLTAMTMGHTVIWNQNCFTREQLTY